jgi:hypothetical protein
MTLKINPITAGLLNELKNARETPFCDKNFGWVRKVSSTVLHCFAEGFWSALSLPVGAGYTGVGRYCKRLANYYDALPLNVETVFAKRDRLIEFSHNGRDPTRDPFLSSNLNGVEELRQIYGQEKMDSILNWEWERELHLATDKLEPIIGGICLGMSYDFIASYLIVSQNSPSLKAIYQIAPRYKNGAPESAQLCRIVSLATDFKKGFDRRIDNSLFGWITKETPARTSKLAQILDGFVILFKLLLLIVVAIPLFCKIRYQKNRLVEEQVKELISYQALNLKEEEEFHYKQEGLDKFLSSLPNGAYEISALPSPIGFKAGHSMALIKTENDHFFFDPNYGTFRLSPSESAEFLSKSIDPHAPPSDKARKVTFARYALKTPIPTNLYTTEA